ncbi:hypothetical protein DN752_11115 [Echinicola strongylocentroti]|uniref:Uncharacterized protein n=1 Tax=Echinicola strongylocentroti TaxID=1795355 RepID=A0A2Z4IIR4_9BACT|nr:hypothetical protein [Echinicola strongylocentroti]AWW30629.1 hypothetical protein DN752_11115 [Echinicola strongylocentroti]
MDVRKIDNLWRFLSIKNNLPVKLELDHHVSYKFIRGNIQVTHQFNPKLWQSSMLHISEKLFQEKSVQHRYHHKKKQFGIHYDMTSTHVQIFFPRELLQLKNQYELDIQKDRHGNYQISLSPFVPKNIYQILDCVNFVCKEMWKKNFFSEGIRN